MAKLLVKISYDLASGLTDNIPRCICKQIELGINVWAYIIIRCEAVFEHADSVNGVI